MIIDSTKNARQKRVAVAVITLLVLNLLATLTVAPTAQAAPIAPRPVPGENLSQPQIISAKPDMLGLATGQYSSLVNMGVGLGYGLRLNAEGYIPPRWSGDWQDFGLYSALPQRLEMPFNRLTANWDADAPTGTEVEMDVRVSPDGENWTMWQILTASGQTADFGTNNAFLFAQYRVRMFSNATGVSPVFRSVKLEANRRDLTNLQTASFFGYNVANTPASQQKAGPPTYNIEATREGLVGWRTANGHIIQERDRFVSLPSWTALNDKGKNDYRVRIVTPKGRTAVAPVWDTGPWNFKDDYWHSPRSQFKDLPVGMPQAEAAYYKKHNGGLNESGRKIFNPSGIDIADGTYWDELDLKGAWDERVDVTFLWENPPALPSINTVEAYGPWQNGFQVRWKTDAPANTWVEYGLTEKLGQTSSVDSAMVKDHNMVLTELVPGQNYYFKVFSEDIYGQKVSLGTFKYFTTPGDTTKLVPFQKDKGIGITLDNEKFGKVLMLGARVNTTYWNDNPDGDFYAGVATPAGELLERGNLSFNLAPVCNEKGENCSMGYGTGFKNFVRFANAKGDTLEVGLIHDSGLSPNSVTLMVETNKGGKADIRRYGKPDATDQKASQSFNFAWTKGKIRFSFNSGKFDTFDFDTTGLTVSFIGAGRYKDDVVAANFENIAWSGEGLNSKRPQP